MKIIYNFLLKIYYDSEKGGVIRRSLLQINLILIYILNFLLNILPFHFYKRLICKIFGMNIGKRVSICSGVRFMSLANFSIGNNSVINRGCLIDNRKSIIVGSNVSIAEGVKIFTLGHNIDNNNFSLNGAEVLIEDHVCIFAYSMIMPGVILERGVVVYPGSIVTHKFHSLSVIAGVPAKFLRFRKCNLKYELDGNFLFN